MTAFSNGFLVTRQCMLSYICKHFGFKASFFFQTFWFQRKTFPQQRFLVSKQGFCSNSLDSKQDFPPQILLFQSNQTFQFPSKTCAQTCWTQSQPSLQINIESKIFFRKYLKQGLDQQICKKNKVKKRFPSNTFVSLVITKLVKNIVIDLLRTLSQTFLYAHVYIDLFAQKVVLTDQNVSENCANIETSQC